MSQLYGLIWITYVWLASSFKFSPFTTRRNHISTNWKVENIITSTGIFPKYRLHAKEDDQINDPEDFEDELYDPRDYQFDDSLEKSYEFIDDIESKPLSEVMRAVCGYDNVTDPSWLFSQVELLPPPIRPTVNRFLLANPKNLFTSSRVLKFLNLNVDQIEEEYLANQRDLSILAKYLPVIYIADMHSEYGTLGLQLNLR
jgi:hypothetical protein